MRRAVEGIERLTGERPVGWMTGRPSMRTRGLVVEEGGFLYDRDALNDELPYWVGSPAATTSSSRTPTRRTTCATARRRAGS